MKSYKEGETVFVENNIYKLENATSGGYVLKDKGNKLKIRIYSMIHGFIDMTVPKTAVIGE